MNSLPASQRGAGAGMSATFQNSAMVLSIGVFFTLIIIGLSASLPHSLYAGLVAQGVPRAAALQVSHLPPVSSLFAAFLGYNPIHILLGPVLPHLSHAHAAYLTGRSFFPRLIAPPFMNGLHTAFDFAILACVLAAVASWLRGPKFIYSDAADSPVAAAAASPGTAASPDGASPVAADSPDGANAPSPTDSPGPATPAERRLPEVGERDKPWELRGDRLIVEGRVAALAD